MLVYARVGVLMSVQVKAGIVERAEGVVCRARVIVIEVIVVETSKTGEAKESVG